MKRLFAYSILAATCSLPVAAQAQSTFDFYGQLNFGLFNVDDGFESETFIIDNDNSNTRIGFNWKTDLGDGRSLRFNFETALGLTGSSAVNIDDTDLEFEYRRTELRKFEFIYSTPSAGVLYLGQGGTATDGVAELDFSGTSVIAYSGLSDLAGGFEFRDAGGAGTGVAIGNAFSSFDGARRFRLRYDTPAWRGLALSFSGGEEILNTDDDNEYYDVAAKYDADYGDYKVGARLGYSWVSGGEEVLLGSLAAIHKPTGLNFAFATGAQQEGNAEYTYTKLGWQQDWLPYGTTALSIDYNDGSDFALDGSDSSSVGLAVVQNIDAYKLEIYATWRTYEFDAPGSSFSDIDVVALGARWKF